MPTIQDVKEFWQNSPLFEGESSHEPGSPEYFREHRRVIEGDCFAGKLDERIFPVPPQDVRVLDLGCGPGFWTSEIAQRGAAEVVGADLTEKGIELARKRAEFYGLKNTSFQIQNAESLTFDSESFSHVNCQGVIHHTPDTQACVREISRVLQPGGTACISVYHKNFFLKAWPVLRVFGSPLTKLGAKLKGRGRENIFCEADPNEIVRLFDGQLNPIGKAYSEESFHRMLHPHFEIIETFLHFFPMRALPFNLPRGIHRALDRSVGFMVFANVKKRNPTPLN